MYVWMYTVTRITNNQISNYIYNAFYCTRHLLPNVNMYKYERRILFMWNNNNGEEGVLYNILNIYKKYWFKELVFNILECFIYIIYDITAHNLLKRSISSKQTNFLQAKAIYLNLTKCIIYFITVKRLLCYYYCKVLIQCSIKLYKSIKLSKAFYL